MNFRGKKNRNLVSIDLTPLIDAVFLLLIFFAVTTTFIATPGIRVNLPGSKVSSLEKEKKELSISLTDTGEIIFEREFVSLEALHDILRKASREDKALLVILRADREVSHGRVVEVMDRVKRSGFNRIAIATKSKDKP